MLDHINYTTYLSDELPYLKKKIFLIMGQLLEYLASVFTSDSSNNRQVKFARESQNEPTKLEVLRKSNKKTIYTNGFIVLISTLAHFAIALWPKLQVDSFDLLELESWKLVALNMMPFFTQAIAICAMMDLNKTLPDGAELGPKNEKLTLDNNEFISSLKVIVYLMAMCQIFAIYSDTLLWAVMLILPLWCYKLASKLASAEFDRHAPSPSKSRKLKPFKLAKLRRSTQQQNSKTEDNNRATPKTRTKKAVKNFFNNVSEKYHTLEQNVAHTISQRMNAPFGAGAKMISDDNDSK